MKNLWFTLAIVVSASFCFAFIPVSPAKTISLKEAIKQDLISLESVSRGSLNKGNFSLKLLNKTKSKLNIQIDKGTHFTAESDPLQDLLIVEPMLVELKGKEYKKVVQTGYCTEVSDRAPTSGATYNLTSEVDEKLLKLADFIETHPKVRKSDDLIQDAIWAVTDDNSISYIYEKDNAEAKELRTFLCELLGKKDLWYNLEHEVSVNEYGNIVNEPMSIKGNIKFKNKKGEKVRCSLVNEEGEEIWSYGGAINFPAGEVTSWFELTIQGWPEGDYTVYYKTETETLLAQEFRLE